jgi:hypothetical protein
VGLIRLSDMLASQQMSRILTVKSICSNQQVLKKSFLKNEPGKTATDRNWRDFWSNFEVATSSQSLSMIVSLGLLKT